MAIYTLTPQQLKGAGVYNSFEIPAGGGSSFASINSFAFDGTDDYITSVTPAVDFLNGRTKLTLSIWIKPVSGAPLLEYILSNPRDTTPGNNQFALVLYEANSISFNVQNRTSQYVAGNISAINYGQWNHVLVCVDLDRTTGTEGAIFINGTNKTTVSAMGTLSSFYNSSNYLTIGKDYNNDYNPYNGKLDEFAIWEGLDLRTPSEVSTIYNSGIPGDLDMVNTGFSKNPQIWYRMGENATWTGREFNITDAAGNYNALSNNMDEDAKSTDVPS